MRLLLLVFFLTLPLQAAAQPKGATPVTGMATFPVSGNTLTITNTPGAVINWQPFSIGSGATNYIQQPSSAAVLNRVLGGQAPQVTGILQAAPAAPNAPPGAQPVAPHVYIVAPSGIAGAQPGGLQTPAVRPASASGAAVLPDGRIVFRATPP
jgi:filamentous hemagglutinin family protein